VDDNWVEKGDKPTHVASRYLLQIIFTSGKHQKVELMNGRYWYINCNILSMHVTHCSVTFVLYMYIATAEYASDIYTIKNVYHKLTLEEGQEEHNVMWTHVRDKGHAKIL
jgi:hypothetical protein